MRLGQQRRRGYHGAGLVQRGGYALLGIIGYILSPASWWNDAIVNIPIAAALALLLERIAGVPFETGFIASYWATNVLGVVLMALGYSGAKNGRPKMRDTIIGLVAATVYTIIAVAVLDMIS